MTKIVALVPMRHHSQRVSGKNYRLLAGKPLFHYIITTLLSVPEVNKVVVDTDSELIMDGLRKHFPSVHILPRPNRFCDDTISMNDILFYDSSQVEADFYLQTHSTNPLLKSETISSAIQTFVLNYPSYDSLFSATRLQTRLWDKLGRAINHNPDVLLQTQDLPPIYEENSCIYLFTRQMLEARRNRLGENPLIFEIDATEAWDIDEELDYDIVDFLMKKRKKASHRS